MKSRECRFLAIDRVIATHWSGGISQTKVISSHIEMVRIKQAYKLITKIEALLSVCWIAGSVAIKNYAMGVFRRG